jgi:hypothetical protein
MKIIHKIVLSIISLSLSCSLFSMEEQQEAEPQQEVQEGSWFSGWGETLTSFVPDTTEVLTSAFNYASDAAISIGDAASFVGEAANEQIRIKSRFVATRWSTALQDEMVGITYDPANTVEFDKTKEIYNRTSTDFVNCKLEEDITALAKRAYIAIPSSHQLCTQEVQATEALAHHLTIDRFMELHSSILPQYIKDALHAKRVSIAVPSAHQLCAQEVQATKSADFLVTIDRFMELHSETLPSFLTDALQDKRNVVQEQAEKFSKK